MKIGDFNIKSGAYLAPMAGVCDVVFRNICKKYSAALSCTEMVSTEGLFYNPTKSQVLMAKEEGVGPHIIQIFGNKPKRMGEMAKKYCMDYDIIDINMGCPAPKIIKNGAGSALMKTPDLACDIVKAVSDETGKPITCKIRSGWDEDNINAIEFAQKLSLAGAKCIALHARSRMQYYSGEANWDLIKKLKSETDVPVIGNGDIKCAKDAKRMLQYTNCDMVMVGRYAQGRPYLFNQIKTYLDTGELIQKPDIKTIMNDALKHALGLIKYYGEYNSVMMMRKHLTWYIKGEKNAASLRNEAVRVQTIDDIYRFIEQVNNNKEITT